MSADETNQVRRNEDRAIGNDLPGWLVAAGVLLLIVAAALPAAPSQISTLAAIVAPPSDWSPTNSTDPDLSPFDAEGGVELPSSDGPIAGPPAYALPTVQLAHGPTTPYLATTAPACDDVLSFAPKTSPPST